MQYYTSVLSLDIAMFVKRLVSPSLVETYEQSIKIEVEHESINKHSVELEIRTFGGKKLLWLIRPKEECSNELEGVVNVVQKLSNKIIDLENDKEANSVRKQYKPLFKKIDESGPSQPPTHSSSIFNFTEVGMDNFCAFIKILTLKGISHSGLTP